MNEYSTIAETKNFIVLDKYVKDWEVEQGYQTEAELERSFIQDLVDQGYELIDTPRSYDAMLANVRVQLETLNNVRFNEGEWKRFVVEYLDKPSDGLVEKTRKVHDDYIYDFVFDDGRIQNIYLVDKKNLARNKLQVIKQFEVQGKQLNRYDVTILVNGLPMVQIELKRRGVEIREAFYQVHRYSRESFNMEQSLYKYLQLFVISNGTDALYFANTTTRDKNSFDFTMNWAMSDNKVLPDIKDFTATFFQKRTLLSVLLTYSVFDAKNTLLIMRPYQIAAAERILWKIHSSYQAKKWGTKQAGGYIWHTTGSGKTLTSFKAARLATEIDFIDKVFFVVDRKDLDYQTQREYQRFSPDSVNGSNSTAELKRNLEKKDNKIIVTTIQKLNNLLKSENNLEIYNQQVVFIFDECHRSQFGEAQRNLQRKFKKYYQFGFTGTPIKIENSVDGKTTEDVFGVCLHSYLITHAIRDDKVLRFKVDYNDVRPQFKALETEQDEEKLSAAENRQALLHPQRIREISQYILKSFPQKTHRLQANSTGFNAMFAVSSVDAAKLYYETLKELQAEAEKPLKIATIFSYAANEAVDGIGTIVDESFDTSALNITAKEFLAAAIEDYNATFNVNFGVDAQGFENYYSDLAKRMRSREVDLLIVIGMFLTGFDAPCLNTLYVDKNLRYHGLIQAYSRTNRIYDATKRFGNIVTFRDLEQHTIKALQLFGDVDEEGGIAVLEGEFKDYLHDLVAVLEELQSEFPDPSAIVSEKKKKEFVTLYGRYLRLDNVLQNFDEYVALKDLQTADLSTPEAVEAFKAEHYLKDEVMEIIRPIQLPTERQFQDYRSTYNDIRDWIRTGPDGGGGGGNGEPPIEWDDVVFEVELLKSQEIDFDYILELIYDKNKDKKNKADLVEEVRSLIRSSIGYRAKEDLVIEFIQETDLDAIDDKAGIIDAFYVFAQKKQKAEATELIRSEGLDEEKAKRYIERSLRQNYASRYGTALNQILPRMSPLSKEYGTKKERVHQLISNFVEKYKDIGGAL